ncbi:MarR family transcriptional regulator [Prescottella agglutinans]|uniref:MarR family transcriptional regulator n=1 Tax=Prescottella agglutinans TaxID=1644129 RepID=A0A438BHW9_9NOCA|nr:MarR family transcriptional regulator [Prescottella agglutinans]
MPQNPRIATIPLPPDRESAEAVDADATDEVKGFSSKKWLEDRSHKSVYGTQRVHDAQSGQFWRQSRRGEHVSDADRVLSEIEYELTLLSRYHALACQRGGQQLDRSAYLILARLELEPPLSLKELSEAFRLDISTINRQVGALLRNGLVERLADPAGGMARKIRPTAKGLDRLREDRDLNLRGIGSVLDGWSDRDVHYLRDILTRFNSDVEQLEGQPWPRPSEDRRPNENEN